MSTRTHLPPQPVIVAGDMSDDITSDPTILQSMTGASYSLSWTGTSPVGTAAIEVSNDYALNGDGTVKNAGTWNVLTLDLNGTPVSSVPVTGNAGTGFIDIRKTMAYAIRLVYTSTSGIGTLDAVFVGKVS